MESELRSGELPAGDAGQADKSGAEKQQRRWLGDCRGLSEVSGVDRQALSLTTTAIPHFNANERRKVAERRVQREPFCHSIYVRLSSGKIRPGGVVIEVKQRRIAIEQHVVAGDIPRLKLEHEDCVSAVCLSQGIAQVFEIKHVIGLVTGHNRSEDHGRVEGAKIPNSQPGSTVGTGAPVQGSIARRRIGYGESD